VKREVGYRMAKGDGMGIEKRVAIWAEAERVHLDMYIINNMLKFATVAECELQITSCKKFKVCISSRSFSTIQIKGL
jgi:hypothetical protein